MPHKNITRKLGQRLGLVLGSWAAYALAFYPLHRWVGGMALSLSIVPVAATGRLLGTRAGLLAGLLAFPVNVLLMTLVTGTASETLATPGGLLNSTVILLLGIGVGQLHDLGEQLKQQLARREQVEKELLEERDFSSAILDTASALVVVLDPEGRIARFNRACERLTGYSFDEAKGKFIWDLFLVPEEVEQVKAAFRELQAGRSSNQFENYWVTRDGDSRLIAWSNAPLLDDEGRVEYVIGTGIDITERVEAEKLLRRRNQELTARNAVVHALSTSLNLQDVLDEAVSGAVTTLGFTGGLVSLADEYTGELGLFSHVGLPHSLIERLETEGLTGTLCHLVYQESMPLDLKDLRDGAPVDAQELLKMGLQSYVGVPIVHKGDTLGTLCLFNTAPHPVSETDYDLLTTIGQQIGIAVENARLFRDVVREREVAQTLLETAKALSTTLRIDVLLQRVLDELQRVAPYDEASINMVSKASPAEGEGRRGSSPVVWTVASRGAEHTSSRRRSLEELPLMRRVVHDRAPVIVSDGHCELDEPDSMPSLPGVEPTQRRGSWLGAPLISNDEVIGVLMVESSRPNAYDEAAARLVYAFAHQVALAIENTRLYEETRSRLREVDLLYGVTAAFSSTLNIDQMLPYIARSLCEVLHGTDAEIYDLNDEVSAITVTAAYAAAGLTKDEDARLPVAGQTLQLADLPATAEALNLCRPIQVQVDDPEADPREQAALEARGAWAVLIVPMLARGRVVGLVKMWDRQGPRRFTRSEIALGQTLIGQAAVAFENARLYEKIEERRSYLESVLAAAPDAIVALDAHHRIAEWNPGAERLFGYSRAEVIGQDIDPLVTDPDMLGEAVDFTHTAMSGESIRPVETVRYRKDGAPVDVILVGSPVLIGDELVGAVAVYTDITERKRAEEELRRAKEAAETANRAKSAFLANMSHELRTPLNAILGFAQLMERSPTFPADHKENLQIIGRSGEHLLDLINDVLDMAKIEAGRTTFDPTSFDLHRTLDSIQNMVSVRTQRKGLQLDFDRASNVPQFVRTDERKLRQVLINLLSNAIKFTEEGSVALRVRVKDKGQKTVDEGFSVARSSSLIFKVKDTGVGIAPEEMDSLFEAFAQTESGRASQEGTGLGLAISRKFVKMMGGDLTVSSQVGHGTTFRFDIEVEPAGIADVEPAQPTRRVVGLEPNQPDYRILVVDDRVENRLLVRQLLEGVGLTVREATNGKEAIDLHESWRPHLIWMDMRMPVMDGYEATRRIRETVKGQATVIIALTASTMENERSLTLSAGCDDHVRKPFHEADLFDKLAQYLGVRYIYKDEDQPADQDDGKVQKPLAPEDFVALPAGWIAELHDAASRARGDLILGLAARIKQDHPSLAKGLAQLVDEFRFDRIMALTEQ